MTEAMLHTDQFADLLRHCPHPYLRVVDARDFRFALLGANGSLAALFSTSSGTPWLLALGSDSVASARALGADLEQASRWTVPRAAEALLGEERSRWDWWLIDTRPAWPAPAPTVVDLGIDHDEEIARLLAIASPTASTPPGDPEVQTWHGIRARGELIAVGAAIRWSSGAPVLASIATHPDHRGRGHARAVTASLTDWFMDRGEMRVHLGMYAANESARATYTAIGYRVAQKFTSGPMPPGRITPSQA
jgi:GNAT superfamily N-acetyltransferase